MISRRHARPIAAPSSDEIVVFYARGARASKRWIARRLFKEAGLNVGARPPTKEIENADAQAWQ
jgi:hypothetical protein